MFSFNNSNEAVRITAACIIEKINIKIDSYNYYTEDAKFNITGYGTVTCALLCSL